MNYLFDDTPKTIGGRQVNYLFIDGNNLGVRSSFANKALGIELLDYQSDSFSPDDVLKHDKRFPTGAIHGFFRSVASIKKMFPERYVCVVWDGKSRKRIAESRAAADRGLIPGIYKESRSKGPQPEELVDFHRQRPEIMAMLSATNIPQVVKPDEEADDIIASFVTLLTGNDVMVLTNDHDYYQLLADGVSILDASGKVLDEAWFRKSYGLVPAQWVEVGGLQGDRGDDIHGLPWWGEGTAVKEIAKYGSCMAVMASYHQSYNSLREKYPDIKGEEFKALKSAKTADGKMKFPGVQEWMPFTGVALAYEQGKVKLPRNVVTALVFEERIALAKSLKAMHRDIVLPALPPVMDRNGLDKFVGYCRKYSLREVEEAADIICSKQAIQI
jgi:5'-3' exonuclease